MSNNTVWCKKKINYTQETPDIIVKFDQKCYTFVQRNVIEMKKKIFFLNVSPKPHCRLNTLVKKKKIISF